MLRARSSGHQRSIERIQSATSLQRLLRDPLGSSGSHALGFDVPQQREQPLTIAPDEFGKLVHGCFGAPSMPSNPPGYAKRPTSDRKRGLRSEQNIVHAA